MLAKVEKPETTERFDVYKDVTDRIIAELESGVKPWVQGWKGGGASIDLPYNVSSDKNYSGVNILLLWLSQASNGYASNGWLTYKQAQALGGSVMAGQHATKIVYASPFVPKDEAKKAKEEGRKPKQIFMMKYYNVFNIEQCEGVEGRSQAPVTVAHVESEADRAIAATGATIKYGNNKACYVPDHDLILLPAIENFKSRNAYYGTTFHELGHWTGHKSRCNREFGKRFGDNAYAFEELVAELCAAFTMSYIRIEGELRDSSSYIDSWLKAMKSDKKYVFQAASLASKAADYILGVKPRENSGAE